MCLPCLNLGRVDIRHSYTTRLLSTVLPSNWYAKKDASVNAILRALADDLTQLLESGVTVEACGWVKLFKKKHPIVFRVDSYDSLDPWPFQIKWGGEFGCPPGVPSYQNPFGYDPKWFVLGNPSSWHPWRSMGAVKPSLLPISPVRGTGHGWERHIPFRLASQVKEYVTFVTEWNLRCVMSTLD